VRLAQQPIAVWPVIGAGGDGRVTRTLRASVGRDPMCRQPEACTSTFNVLIIFSFSPV